MAIAASVAEINNGSPASGSTASVTGTSAEAVAPDPPLAVSPVAKPIEALSAANLTALLDALLKKGVLTPSEVNFIRVAAPEAELQLLIEALTRKGVLNATDLAATPAAAPAPVATPAPAAGARPAPKPQSAPVPQPELAELKPPAVSAVPAIVPLRVLPLMLPNPAD
jgi:hypothetical protein